MSNTVLVDHTNRQPLRTVAEHADVAVGCSQPAPSASGSPVVQRQPCGPRISAQLVLAEYSSATDGPKNCPTRWTVRDGGANSGSNSSISHGGGAATGRSIWVYGLPLSG